MPAAATRGIGYRQRQEFVQRDPGCGGRGAVFRLRHGGIDFVGLRPDTQMVRMHPYVSNVGHDARTHLLLHLHGPVELRRRRS